MTVIVNPFDGGGYTLAEMTAAIQLLPNRYGRLGALGLFAPEPISQRQVTVEQIEGELRLLPAVALGAPATVGSPETASMRSFTVPHIPHNDVVLPEEVQGKRGFGLAAAEDPLAQVMMRKLTRMRWKHAQTLEYMRAKALHGITKDGAGRTVYDWHAEFAITAKSVDFKLGTETTDVLGKCREVLRHVEENLKGESMTSVHAMVSPGFWDKLIVHKRVEEAYKYFEANAGLNPLRQDLRTGFRFGGLAFEEYLGTVTLSTGQTDSLLTVGEGIAFPMGTTDTFRTFLAPANLMDAVGTYGQELYAYQIARENGTGIDVYSQSNPLPIVKRPALVVRLFSSN